MLVDFILFVCVMVDLLLGKFCWLFCGCWFAWCCSLCLLLWQLLFGFKVVLMVLGLVVFVWCMVLVWVWLLCLVVVVGGGFCVSG